MTELLTNEEINKVKEKWFKSFTYIPLWETFPVSLIAKAQRDKDQQETEKRQQETEKRQ